MRLFFAFEIPEQTITEIETKIQSSEFLQFENHAKRLKTENWHCTILFFRDYPGTKLNLIKDLCEKYKRESQNFIDLIDWQEFQVWETVLCLCGKVLQSDSIKWFIDNIPEEIKQYSQFNKLEKWKPHISLYRIRNNNLEDLRVSSLEYFPLVSKFQQIKFETISLFINSSLLNWNL